MEQVAPPTPAMPPPLRVELQFEYTPDELREGLRPPERVAGARRATRKAAVIAWLLLLIFAVSGYIVLEANVARPVAPPPGETQRPAVNFLLTLGPSYIASAIVGLFFASVLVAVRLTTAAPERRRFVRPAIIAGMVIIGAIVWAFLAAFDQLSAAAEVTRLSQGTLLLLALAPWFAMLVLLIVAARRMIWRRTIARPAFRRRRLAVIDTDGFQHGDDFSTARYRWPFFRRAWETANVLVLSDENQLRHILPKRAFATPADLRAAKALIVTNIADTNLLLEAKGFEVGGPRSGDFGSATPVPVLPIEDTAATPPPPLPATSAATPDLRP